MSALDLSEQESRRSVLVRTVIESGAKRVEELANELDVSLVTIYRDVQHLEQLGVAHLDRGYVTIQGASTMELPPQIRAQQAFSEKAAIAREASTFISPNSAIMVDDSSSVLPILDYISKPITIITNSLTVSDRVRDRKEIDLIMTAGRLHHWANALYGSLATSSLDNVRADICFMSDAAIWRDAIYNPIEYVIDMKRKMLAQSEVHILLLDSSKFARKAWQKTASLNDFDVIITDENASSEHIEELGEYAEVIVARR